MNEILVILFSRMIFAIRQMCGFLGFDLYTDFKYTLLLIPVQGYLFVSYGHRLSEAKHITITNIIISGHIVINLFICVKQTENQRSCSIY